MPFVGSVSEIWHMNLDVSVSCPAKQLQLLSRAELVRSPGRVVRGTLPEPSPAGWAVPAESAVDLALPAFPVTAL